MKQIRISKKLSDILLRTIGQKMRDELIRVIEEDDSFLVIGYFTHGKLRKITKEVFGKGPGILYLDGEDDSDSEQNVLKYLIGKVLEQNGLQTTANALRKKYSSILSPKIPTDRYEEIWKDLRDNSELAALIALLFQEKLGEGELPGVSDYTKARIVLDGTDFLIEEIFFLAGFSIAGDKKMKKLFSNLLKVSLRCMPLWCRDEGIICISE